MIACKFENGTLVRLRHVCADTLVLRGNKILLVKRAMHLREGGKWGLIGGFMDPDETLEETVKREVLEETGHQISGVKLLTIIDNPNRPNDDRQNISFVYYCQAGEKVGEPDDESTEQRWFNLDDLPPKEDLAFEFADDIDLYKQYLAGKASIPLINQ